VAFRAGLLWGWCRLAAADADHLSESFGLEKAEIRRWPTIRRISSAPNTERNTPRLLLFESLAPIPAAVVSDKSRPRHASPEAAGGPLPGRQHACTPCSCPKPIDYGKRTTGATLIVHLDHHFLSATALRGPPRWSLRASFDWSKGGKFTPPKPRRARAPPIHGLNCFLRELPRHGLHLPQPRLSACPKNPWAPARRPVSTPGSPCLASRPWGCRHGAPFAPMPRRSPSILRKAPRPWRGSTIGPAWRRTSTMRLARKFLPKGAGSILSFTLPASRPLRRSP